MACRLYNTERCLQLQLFNRPNFGVHFSFVPFLLELFGYSMQKHYLCKVR